MTPHYLQKAEAFLKKQDPLLGTMMDAQTLSVDQDRGDYFEALCRSIIGQQVSVAAARTIYNRFAEATDASPHKVAQLDEVAIKQIGLSGRKASYLKDLAARFIENPSVYNHLEKQTDDEVIAELVLVKGIGVWTAQMFLMFTLGRPDVFAPDDVGLQRAMMKLYGWSELPPRSELVAVAEKWAPHRSVASLHLWRYLDNTPS